MIAILLTGGEAHDRPVADRGIRRVKPSKHLLGDKAYDSAELRCELDERGSKRRRPPPAAMVGAGGTTVTTSMMPACLGLKNAKVILGIMVRGRFDETSKSLLRLILGRLFHGRRGIITNCTQAILFCRRLGGNVGRVT